jgi:CelD/BcsL family acetyltransferase involved in cellulose biosynthesis
VWWQEFGDDSNLFLHSVRQGDELIGIAPLLVNGESALFIGSPNVCDYLDFVVTPGREQDFFDSFLDNLDKQGIARLDLRALRPDSTVRQYLADAARDRGCEVSFHPDGVSFELDLPSTWEEYLQILKGKHRHETRRKLRRLHEAAEINFRVFTEIDEVKGIMGTFLKLFRESREDKTVFMTTGMESFFNSLALAMAEIKVLRVYVLELDAQPAATVLCFDYNSTLYLYNSGYDPRFSPLSVGLLCKILNIKDSIQRGIKRYDFLKGEETYKYRLGGQEVPLSRCEIRLA